MRRSNHGELIEKNSMFSKTTDFVRENSGFVDECNGFDSIFPQQLSNELKKRIQENAIRGWSFEMIFRILFFFLEENSTIS